jgi:two-component system alkaline phosphatase synthesis response regulator PhoP
MSGERVLIVDDERPLLEGIAHNLRQAGYQPAVAMTGEEAIRHLEQQAFDVGVLDVMLPGISGFDLCRRIRADGNDMPIILLTARDAEDDRVQGLECGADDYVVKPFSQRELTSRVAALLRRREMDARAAMRSQTVIVLKLEVDLSTQRVWWDDQRILLTPSEYEVVAALARANGAPVSRGEIVRGLWNSDHTGDDRVCDVHIHSIRQKIRRVAGDPSVIRTVRGLGYALKA